MSDYEPPAELVDALAKELHTIRNNGLMENIARFVLRRQHERERGLLEALRTVDEYGGSVSSPVARHALRAHAALDAPKVPSLLEAAKGALGVIEMGQQNVPLTTATRATVWLPDPRIDALKAAIEREDGKNR